MIMICFFLILSGKPTLWSGKEKGGARQKLAIGLFLLPPCHFQRPAYYQVTDFGRSTSRRLWLWSVGLMSEKCTYDTKALFLVRTSPVCRPSCRVCIARSPFPRVGVQSCPQACGRYTCSV